MNIHLRLWALASGLVWLAACSLAPEPAPVAPVDEVPEAFAAPGTPGEHAPLEWWREFDDPTLDRLLDSALVGNLDLAEAVGRVQEARATAGVALADLLPQLSTTADVSRTSNPNNAGFALQIGELLAALRGDTASTGDGGGGGADGADGGSDGPPSRFSVANYNVSMGLSWELDFWGRARNDRAAAVADLLASESDLHAARLSVLAETITAYFDWVDLRQRLEFTQDLVAVLRERAALTETRYDRGLVGSFELYQIRQELQSAEAGLPQLRVQFADVERRLALLTGRHLQALRLLLSGPTNPTIMAAPIAAGVPSDVLVQRPDVWAAGLRFEAARRRVGARRANLLPGLTLSGTVGLQSADAGTLFRIDQWFSNLAAGLTAPLFQGGRLRANLSAAEARYAQQLAVYARTVLTAIGEAELALTRMDQEAARSKQIGDQLEAARAAAELQAERYAAGVAQYPEYLDALRNRLALESTLSQAQRDLALARLSLHRALGGAWVSAPESEGNS